VTTQTEGPCGACGERDVRPDHYGQCYSRYAALQAAAIEAGQTRCTSIDLQLWPAAARATILFLLKQRSEVRNA